MALLEQVRVPKAKSLLKNIISPIYQLATCSEKIYLKELHRLGSLATDLTVNIKNFKQNKKHKRVGLNDEEITLLVSTSLPANKSALVGE